MSLPQNTLLADRIRKTDTCQYVQQTKLKKKNLKKGIILEIRSAHVLKMA
jgi:hypothetical protein